MTAALVEILLVLTGKALVSLLSFGRWRGESLTSNESGVRAAAGALSFVRDDQRVVTTTGLTLLGMVFYGLLLTALFYWATRG